MGAWPTEARVEEHLNLPGDAAPDAALLAEATAASITEIATRTRFAAADVEIPDDVALAALLSATKLYHRRNTPDGIAGDGEFGVVRSNRFDPDVERLIRPYLTVAIAIV